MVSFCWCASLLWLQRLVELRFIGVYPIIQISMLTCFCDVDVNLLSFASICSTAPYTLSIVSALKKSLKTWVYQEGRVEPNLLVSKNLWPQMVEPCQRPQCCWVGELVPDGRGGDGRIKACQARAPFFCLHSPHKSCLSNSGPQRPL